MLEATVASRRTSESLKACSRSKLSTMIEPITRSLPTMGTLTPESATSVPGRTPLSNTSAFVRVTFGSRRPTIAAHRSGVGVEAGTDSRMPCSNS